MGVSILIPVEEYLRTSYDPDRDFIDGQTLERNVGKKRHSFAQISIGSWLFQRRASLQIEPFTEQRLRISARRVRIPDILIMKAPSSDEAVFTTPPYVCIELMSPDDTMSSLQERMDDYMGFGVDNVWVIDPWTERAWNVTSTGWHAALDGILRTSDARIKMPLADVLLP